ncbi:hypothetical protein [Streptomyces sp. CA-106131]|uniref:hypothetical protein n=1 Tax=Streptomyces sp. CA-106131 TaxID=3240045 RepID=UPI003D8C08B4
MGARRRSVRGAGRRQERSAQWSRERARRSGAQPGLGIPPHVVRDIVGHSALDVTMNIYAHADMTEKRAALDRLAVIC